MLPGWRGARGICEKFHKRIRRELAEDEKLPGTGWAVVEGARCQAQVASVGISTQSHNDTEPRRISDSQPQPLNLSSQPCPLYLIPCPSAPCVVRQLVRQRVRQLVRRPQPTFPSPQLPLSLFSYPLSLSPPYFGANSSLPVASSFTYCTSTAAPRRPSGSNRPSASNSYRRPFVRRVQPINWPFLSYT